MERYSVFYHHIRCAAQEKGCTVERMLEAIRQWGIQYVELDRDDVGADEASIRQLGRMLHRHDLQPSSIYGFYAWEQADQLPAADDLLLRQAHLLDCKRVMLIPGFHADLADASLCQRENARMQASTCRMAELAAAQGLEATIECFDDSRSPIATIAGMADFLQAAPHLGVTLETGNFLFSGDDVLEAQQCFAGRIRHVHLKDRFLPELSPSLNPTGEPKTAVTGQVMYPCAVGHGHIPMTQVLDELERQGYQGIMTIEHFGVPSYAEAIRDSVTWLKERKHAL